MEHVIHLNSFCGRISKDRKRVGRGIGSGKGNTSGAGHKGQCARSGTSMKRRHAEFVRRFPKVGFTSTKPDMSILTLDRLSRLIEQGGLDTKKVLTIKELASLGVSVKNGLKIIGNSNTIKAVKIQANKISKGASECLTKAGGSVEIVEGN